MPHDHNGSISCVMRANLANAKLPDIHTVPQCAAVSVNMQSVPCWGQVQYCGQGMLLLSLLSHVAFTPQIENQQEEQTKNY